MHVVIINIIAVIFLAFVLWVLGVILGTYWWFFHKGLKTGYSLMNRGWEGKKVTDDAN